MRPHGEDNMRTSQRRENRSVTFLYSSVASKSEICARISTYAKAACTLRIVSIVKTSINPKGR